MTTMVVGVGSDKCVHRLPKVCNFNIIISQISCGEEHSSFVSLTGGNVYSMGSNSEGNLALEINLSNSPMFLSD